MVENTTKQNEYTWSAKYYDELSNESVVQEDVSFYKSFLASKSSVLEVGCGTGRVGLALARICTKYTGLDLSPEMLDIFKGKLENSDQNITLIEADMTDFELDQAFDLIIFPFRSFQALTTNNQRNKCLSLCKKYLKVHGKIIIQMFNPIIDKLEKFNTLNTHDSDVLDRQFKIERHTIGKDHDKINQTISASYVYKVFEGGSLVETIEEPLQLGYMTEKQASSLFESHDLTVSNVYKWWDFSNVDEDLKELIFVLINND